MSVHALQTVRGVLFTQTVNVHRDLIGSIRWRRMLQCLAATLCACNARQTAVAVAELRSPHGRGVVGRPRRQRGVIRKHRVRYGNGLNYLACFVRFLADMFLYA